MLYTWSVSITPTELPTAPEQVLPVLGGETCERADAARNRARILAVAARLFDQRGVENVSMDAIAEAAGVGKGTLFRRFGDRAGLAHSLLNERERELQEELIRGDPPLGPVPDHLDYEMWTGPAPLRPYDMLPHRRWWRTFNEYGNGIVGDMCVHMLADTRGRAGCRRRLPRRRAARPAGRRPPPVPSSGARSGPRARRRRLGAAGSRLRQPARPGPLS